MVDNTPLCCECFEKQYNFEPDMGDDVNWRPGTCISCKRHMILFTIAE